MNVLQYDYEGFLFWVDFLHLLSAESFESTQYPSFLVVG